jgi:hypothetical protein
MRSTNLFVTFERAGDGQLQIRTASRMEVDGGGILTLHDAQTGAPERIAFPELKSLSIQPLPRFGHGRPPAMS